MKRMGAIISLVLVMVIILKSKQKPRNENEVYFELSENGVYFENMLKQGFSSNASKYLINFSELSLNEKLANGAFGIGTNFFSILF